MWTVSATQMVARLTSSTLFANAQLVSMVTADHRSMATSSDSTSVSAEAAKKNAIVISKMRDIRGRNPYAAFVKDTYHNISAQYPDMKLGEVSKKVAAAWKILPDEKKQDYVKKAQDQKAHYEQEKQSLSPTDLQTVTADEKARRIERRVRKNIQQLPTNRPRSAYTHFLSSLTRGEADLKDFMIGAAQQWSKLSTEDKQKYVDMHEQEKQSYVKALIAWDSAHASVPTQAPTPKKTSSRRSSSKTPSKTKSARAR